MEEALTFLEATACAAEACLSSESEAEGGDGPYFDLEFSARENDKSVLTESIATMSADGEHDDDDHDHIPDQEEEEESATSDNELFLKGNGVLVDGASEVVNSSKVSAFLLKLLLKLKKSKPSETLCGENKIAEAAQNNSNEDSENGNKGNKFFAVKFNVHEVPLMSLFTRDNSSKEKLTRQESSYSDEGSAPAHRGIISPDERNKQQQIAKEVHKYLKMIKPFYVRVSKRYAEKLKGSKCGAPTTSPPRVVEEESGKGRGGIGLKQRIHHLGQLPAGLRVRLVRKRLGKGRSASSTGEVVVVVPAPGSRRDDSFLQIQDGVHGAIMHCKRSFNASLGNY